MARDCMSWEDRLLEMPISPELRPYQMAAITATERAIVEGQRSVVLNMAQGTGKPATALNEICRLMASGVATKVLYLVDRRVTAQQFFEAAKNFMLPGGNRFADVYRVYVEGEGLARLLRDEEVSDSGGPAGQPSPYLCISTLQGFHRHISSSSSAASFTDALATLPPQLFDLMVNYELDRRFVVRGEDIREAITRHFQPITISFVSSKPDPEITDGVVTFQYTLEQAIADGALVNYWSARTRPAFDHGTERERPNHRVFLFCADGDRLDAAGIADEMRSAGFSVLPDIRTERQAADTLTGILHDIRSGDTLVFLLTPDSISNPWLHTGLDQLLARRGAELVPAVLKPCPIPQPLADQAVVDATEGAWKLIHSLRWTEVMDFATLDGRRFADLAADLLRRIGFSLEAPAGADVGFNFRAVYHDRLGFADPTQYVIQVKYGTRNRPSVRDLRRLVETLPLRESLHALVVTNVQLTSLAQASLVEAGREQVQLHVLDGPRIKDFLLDHPDLVSKYFPAGKVTDEHA